jgi:hypothetical protein
MLKSIGVVVGSYVLSMALVLASDPLLSRIFPGEFERGHVPSQPPLLASTAFFIVISIFCAFLCARFAPGSAAKHVLWFFLIGEVFGIVATIPNWSKPGWPHWYWLSWILSWPITCYIGLLIGRRERKAEPATA